MISDIVRTPIVRKAIKFTSYRQKLLELCNDFLPSDVQIMNIVRHYEMLVRDFKRQNWYSALGNKGKKHKNWTLFEKFFDMCRSNGYDANLYLDVHFKKARKYWTNDRYPLPNMLLGDKARNYYEMAVKDLREKYAKDVHADQKMAAKQTMSLQSQILKDIADSVNILKFYMGTVKTVNSPEHIKVSIIYSFWSSLSPYYLYSVPWFRKYIEEMLSIEGHSGVEYMHEEFVRVDRSKLLQHIITEGVDVAESELNIPRNIDIM